MHTGQRGHAETLSVIVAVLCTAMAVVVFVTSTSPAAHERTRLRAVEDAHVHLHAELSRRLLDLESRTAALTWDPQTLLIAIDDAGMIPAELLDEVPPGLPPIPAWTPPMR